MCINFKRFLSLLLALVMVVSYVPASTFATENEECTHSYEEIEVNNATCAQAGKRTMVCSLCGDTQEETIAVLDEHSFAEGAETCTNCSEPNPDYVAPHEHDWTQKDGICADADCGAACEQHSFSSGSCTVCGKPAKCSCDVLCNEQVNNDCELCGESQSLCQAQAPVDEVQETFVAAVDGVQYATLAEAVEAAENGAIITLLDNIDFGNVTTTQISIPNSKTLTIDLNGKMISAVDGVASGSFTLIENYGNLTIDDSQGGGKISMSAATNRVWGGQSTMIGNANVSSGSVQVATLTIAGGTIEHTGGSDMAFAINHSNNTGTAVLNITDGKIIGQYRTIRMFQQVREQTCDIFVTGGEIISTGNSAIWLQETSDQDNENTAVSKLVINGNAKISGVGADVKVTNLGSYIDAVCTISGGTFANDPSAYVAEGYVATQDGENYVVSEAPAVDYVAQVNGDAKYETLADAVAAAAADGAIVTLLKSASGAGIVINKNITIDFGGYTYSFTSGVGSTGTETNGFQILSGNTVTLQNGTLNVAEANKGDFYILIQNYADLTVTNMTLDGTNLDKYSETDTDSYVLSNNSGNVSISDTTIIGNNEGALAYAFDACKYEDYPAPTVEATNCTVTGTIEVTGGTLTVNGGTYKAFSDANSNDKVTDAFVCSSGTLTINGDVKVAGGNTNGATAVWAKENGKVVINGGGFTVGADSTAAEGYNDLIYAKDNAVVEIKGGTFNGPARQKDNQKFLLNLKDSCNAKIIVTGGAFIGFNPADTGTEPEGVNDNFVAEGYEATESNGVYTVAQKAASIAKAGDKEYETLADAVAAAESGAIVTLLKNASGAGIVINKNITIDFDGYTYSFTSGVGSTGTESNGFQILNGNTVTLQNGALNVAAESADLFYALIQNYANLTVTDMTLDGTYLDKWAKDANQEINGDSYVLSNNSGNVLVNGNTSIIANDDGNKAYTVDSCKKDAYATPTVTIETTGTINGKVEVTGGNMVINGGNFHARKVNGSYTDTDVFVVSSGLLTINNANVDGGDKEDTTAVWAHTSGHVVIENGTFTLSGKNVSSGHNDMIYAGRKNSGTGAVIEVKGGSFSATAVSGEGNAANVWLLNERDNEGTMIVTGGTYANNFNPGAVYTEPTQPKSFLAEGYAATEVDGKWVVGVKADEVAQAGDKKYETLADAVAAAADGATVTLLKDASGAGIVINKNITIDFGGYTYSFTSGVGSTGTETNGFQILSGNTVTLQNGKLDVAAESADLFYILIQNYANLTVTNMTLDGTNLDKYSATDGDSYVLSNNSGRVTINGSTTIKDNDVGSRAYALDACKYASYAVPTVTINTTGTISGILEVNGGNMIINSGEFNGAGEDGLLWVKSGNATVNGGTFNAELGAHGYSMAVWAKGGNVTINGGTFRNLTDGTERGTDLIYASMTGKVSIKGGIFEAAKPEWTLNCRDTDFNTGSASITVTGGSFTGFDPSNNEAEGAGTNFVAEGYEATKNGGVYTVAKKTTKVENSSSNVTVKDETGADKNVNVGAGVGAEESQGKIDIVVTGEQTKEEVQEKLEQNNVTTTTVQEAVTSNEKTSENLEKAAVKQVQNVVDDVVKKDAVTKLAEKHEELSVANITNVQVDVKPYLDVAVKNYKEETTTDESGNAVTTKTLSLNIEAKYDLVATTTTTEGETKTAVVAEDQKLDTKGQNISITIPLPEEFKGEQHIYIRHTKADGTVYNYSTEKNVTDGTLTFINPNGFSQFEAYTSSKVVETDDPVVLPKFVATNMYLGSAIDIRFWIDKTELAAEAGSYAEIVQNGKTTTVPMSEWLSNGNYHLVPYLGTEAKQMCDAINVTVYDANGVAISQQYNKTVGEAIVGLHNTQSDEDYKNLAIAMLNYGAAAQKAFDYEDNGLATDYLSQLN